MTTPANVAGDIFEIALETLATDQARERQRLLDRAAEFDRIHITLHMLRANGVEISAGGVSTTTGSVRTAGELIVQADIPLHCRARLQQLVDGGLVDMDLAAGHNRDLSVFKHDLGWFLFVKWTEPALAAAPVGAPLRVAA